MHVFRDKYTGTMACGPYFFCILSLSLDTCNAENSLSFCGKLLKVFRISFSGQAYTPVCRSILSLVRFLFCLTKRKRRPHTPESGENPVRLTAMADFRNASSFGISLSE